MSPDDFLASYTRLMECVRTRIFAEQNSEYLLELATFYGGIRQQNLDGVYFDNEVEQHVADQVQKDIFLQTSTNMSANQGTVLIASELLDFGGHSRVVRNWLKCFQESKDHSLLITRSVTRAFEDFLKANDHSYHVCRSQGIELVREVIKYCEHAQRIVLHIHPDDIIAATAANLLARAGKVVIFFNHADHIFSYGFTSASVVCEVSSYGISVNRRTGRSSKSCFVGIPIDTGLPDKTNGTNDSPAQPSIVLSSGAPYKYRPAEVSFGDFIDKFIVQWPEVTVVLVGPEGNEPWWANHEERWGDKVRFLGSIPHDQFLNVMATVAVYVDSFPISGGTAFPEALLNGKKVAGIQNPIQGYSPVDELRVKTVDELERTVRDLLAGNTIAIEKIEQVRLKAREAHSLDGFRSRVLAGYEGKCEPCPWQNIVNNDMDWLERTWKANAKLKLDLENIRLFRLPISFMFAFLVKRYALQEPPRYRYVAFAVTCLIVRALPAPVRNFLLNRRGNIVKQTFG
jgi:hypothetical protein